MTIASAATAAYIAASLLFILSLAGLSNHETACQGLAYGAGGMLTAPVAALLIVIRDGAGRGDHPGRTRYGSLKHR